MLLARQFAEGPQEQQGKPSPTSHKRVCVEWVRSIKFLGVQIYYSLSWFANTTVVVKKALQLLHFLRVLKRKKLEEKLLILFYRATIKSILAYGITALYRGCSAADRRELQRVINIVRRITGCSVPSQEFIATTRCLSRAASINMTHPTPATTCSTCYPQADDMGRTKPGQIRSAFSQVTSRH